MKQEVYSLTYLKGICAMLVVLIHTHMIGKVALIPFYRCAVPLFFMISGYFLMGG
ncbi:MAG: acyltransferase family protein [Prevotella sp.]|nr:acyltransferase family protein [Prevotella sp.]